MSDWWEQAPLADETADWWSSSPMAKPQEMWEALDYERPIADVRKDIAALSPDQREMAVKALAQVRVKKERANTNFSQLPTPTIPVIGPYLDEGFAGINAGLNAVSGGRLGEPYDEGLALIRERERQARDAAPVMGVAGDVGAGIVAGTALPMARVFGNPVAPTAMNTAGNAALTAGAYGAVEGFGYGEGGLDNRLQNAQDVGVLSTLFGGVLGGTTQAVANRLAPTRPNSAAAAGQQIGVEVPQFMDGGTATQQTAAKMGAIPFVGDDINSAVARTRSQSSAAAQNISDAVAGQRVTPQQAGEAISADLVDFAGPRARQIQNRVYDAVDRTMTGVVVPLSQTRQAAAALAAEQTAAAAPLHARALGEVQEALARPNGLQFEGLSRLRTRIGALIDNALDPENATARAGLQRIYAALTDDMQTSIATNGGQAAQRAWARAQEVTRRIAERRDSITRLVGAEGDKAGEGIVDRLVTMASSKGSADAARLGQIRRTVGADEWRQLAAAAIQRLGRNQSNEFSAEIFLKNYTQLSDEGRRLLFNSTGDNIMQPLEALATVSRRLQQFSRLGNPSGTGGVTALVAALAGAGVGDMGATAVTMGGGRIIGSLMSRPAVIRGTTRYGQMLERFLNGRATAAQLSVAAAELARITSQETGEDARAIEERLLATSLQMRTGGQRSQPQDLQTVPEQR